MRCRIAMLLLVMTATSARAGEPPKVDIRVSIVGNALDDFAKTAKARDAIPDAIQRTLFDICTHYLKFLQWTTGDAANETHLDAAIKSVDGQVLLVFTGVLNGVRFAEEPARNSIVLFDKYDRPPPDLRSDIMVKVKRGFNEVLRDRLHDYFFAHIPLTREPLHVVDPEMVVVPLSRSRLHLMTESMLGVEFDDGKVQSTLSVASLPRAWRGDISCRVLSLRRGGRMTDGWSPQIARIFGTPPAARNVQVLMTKYVFDPNPGTKDGLELEK